MDDVETALTKSSKDFIEEVYPKIKDDLGNGNLIPVQAVTSNEMAILLDRYAAIDAWYIETEKGIRGLASRIQYDANYQTFTIRKERETGTRTEYEKICHAISHNWLYPYWFCQAYIQNNPKKLLSVGLCKTCDLINYIRQGQNEKDYYVKKVLEKGVAFFYVVPWVKFRKKFCLLTYPKTL